MYACMYVSLSTGPLVSFTAVSCLPWSPNYLIVNRVGWNNKIWKGCSKYNPMVILQFLNSGPPLLNRSHIN
ncbi:hypothetical protein F5B19DRAFT_458794 [Rostrohypoxylon terebratum]|nr:hypothetical protein F5B19DRAFT_458794 [Rostrohypoxylon terebratum]